MVLDPSNEFNVDRTLTKDDVQKLIKVFIGQLLYFSCLRFIWVSCCKERWKNNFVMVIFPRILSALDKKG